MESFDSLHPLLRQLPFVGLLAQTTAIALLFAFFVIVGRQPRTGEYFGAWTRAYGALVIALIALVVRYTCVPPASLEATPGDSLWLRRGAQAVYAAGKLGYFALLLDGALRFADARIAARVRRIGLAALVLLGAAGGLLLGDLDALIIGQAPLAVACSCVAALFLLHAPEQRRSRGSWLSAGMLFAQALLWIGYGFAFHHVRDGEPPSFDSPWTLLTNYNSLADLLVQMLMGFGLVVILMQDLRNEAARAHVRAMQLERQLSEAHKLEAVGALVSGVAHELNNPLTAILGFSEQLLADQAGSAAVPTLTVIKDQALRCRGIVRDLLSFVGSREERWEDFELVALVERVARGLQPEFARNGAALECEVEEPIALRGDPVGIEQVISNLLTNAAQAAGRGGHVRLRTRRVGEWAEIEVVDDGPGVPPHLLTRVFEPFFTTKAPGQGSGLGLSVSHGLVRGHGGSIAAENLPAPAHGARFTVRLPLRARAPAAYTPWPLSVSRPPTPHPLRAELPLRELRPLAPRPPTQRPGVASSGAAAGAARSASAPAASAATSASSGPGARGERARVLLVEDEPAVRTLLRSVFERDGWSVDEAGDGRAGLERLLAPGAAYDIVVTDLRMPHVSGAELHAELGNSRPALQTRLVCVTGDTISAEAQRFERATGVPVLAKPLDLKHLIEVCRERAGLAPARCSETP